MKNWKYYLFGAATVWCLWSLDTRFWVKLLWCSSVLLVLLLQAVHEWTTTLPEQHRFRKWWNKYMVGEEIEN